VFLLVFVLAPATGLLTSVIVLSDRDVAPGPGGWQRAVALSGVGCESWALWCSAWLPSRLCG
jgi:hypothetical protein